MAGLEASGIGLITRAVELDGQKRYTESLICYQEGIQLLMNVIKESNRLEAGKASAIRTKVSQCMDRAEAIKDHINSQKTNGRYHEQISIPENATGFSYDVIFTRFLEANCVRVEVDDPYIRSQHQIMNFLRFCELLVSKKCGVREIVLKTGQEENSSQAQEDKLRLIGASLKEYDIILTVEYSHSLHDREIRLSNRWVIKIGRGLDYFKPPGSKFTLGTTNFNLRKCHQTTVDVFYRVQ